MGKEALVNLAKLGNWGTRQQNVERDFQRQFGAVDLPFPLKPWFIEVDLRRTHGHGVEKVLVPCFAPHEMLALLFRLGPDVFQEFLLGRPFDFLTEFWGALQNLDWVRAHPALQSPLQWSTTIPLLFHGDEAEFLDDQQVYVLSWKGALSHGPSAKSRYLVAALPCRLLVSQVSLQQVLKFVAWSLGCMTDGHWPLQEYDVSNAQLPLAEYRQEFAGQPLCQGFRCAFMGTKGDLKFQHMHCYTFSRYYLCHDLCPQCTASKVHANRLYTDLRPGRWTQSYATCTGALKSVPGWHHATIWLDPMHLLYVHGCASDLVGSVVVLASTLALFEGPDLTFEGQMHQAWLDFRSWCKRHGLQCTHDGFDRNSFHYAKNNQYPWMNGKAADVRLAVLWLADDVSRRDFRTEEVSKAVNHCVLALAQYIHVVARADVLMSPDEAQAAHHTGSQFVRWYLHCAWLFAAKGQTLFKTRPKLHYFWHVCQQLGPSASRLNPNVHSCFMDEDMVGRVSRVASRTHRRTTALRSLERFLFQFRREVLEARRRKQSGATPPPGCN